MAYVGGTVQPSDSKRKWSKELPSLLVTLTTNSWVTVVEFVLSTLLPLLRKRGLRVSVCWKVGRLKTASESLVKQRPALFLEIFLLQKEYYKMPTSHVGDFNSKLVWGAREIRLWVSACHDCRHPSSLWMLYNAFGYQRARWPCDTRQTDQRLFDSRSKAISAQNFPCH